MNKATIEELKREADARYFAYKAEFEEYDNAEDMHLRNSWDMVRRWLQEKLTK